MSTDQTIPYKKPLIIDWGIGGLGTVTHLPKEMGFVYVSDSGFAPYGTVDHDILHQRLVAITQYAASHLDCDVAVIACNAASAALENRSLPLGTLDIISTATGWIKNMHTPKLGVIGGKGTIQSKIFSRILSGKTIVETEAQALSAWVEQGVLDGVEVTQTIQNLALKLGDISHLLLACTHYPALYHVFKQVMPAVELLDPATVLASQLAQQTIGPDQRVYLTSGDPDEMQRAARRAFDHPIEIVQSLPL